MDTNVCETPQNITMFDFFLCLFFLLVLLLLLLLQGRELWLLHQLRESSSLVPLLPSTGWRREDSCLACPTPTSSSAETRLEKQHSTPFIPLRLLLLLWHQHFPSRTKWCVCVRVCVCARACLFVCFRVFTVTLRACCTATWWGSRPRTECATSSPKRLPLNRSASVAFWDIFPIQIPYWPEYKMTLIIRRPLFFKTHFWKNTFLKTKSCFYK